MSTSVNQIVEVNAFAFNRRPRSSRLSSFPRRMVWDDREYNFAESGMQYLVQKGHELVRLFDVSDGQQDFRLKYAGDQWTLVSIRTA